MTTKNLAACVFAAIRLWAPLQSMASTDPIQTAQTAAQVARFVGAARENYSTRSRGEMATLLLSLMRPKL